MSAEKITQQIPDLFQILQLLNGKFSILVLIALGAWQATKMSSEQIDTFDRLVKISDCGIGYIGAVFFGGLVIILTVYSLILSPAGKFVKQFSAEITVEVEKQNKLMTEHIDGSKKTFHFMNEMREETMKSQSSVLTKLDGLMR